MNDARTLHPNGHCHDCGRPVSGERRLCGQCAARRTDEITARENRLAALRKRADRERRNG